MSAIFQEILMILGQHTTPILYRLMENHVPIEILVM